MIHVDSTIEEKEPQINYCVVYDGRHGNIVSRHGFIGDGSGLFGPDGKEERARIALEGAKRHPEADQLKVLHVPPDFRFEPDMLHRVDLKSGRIVAVSGTALEELIKKRRQKERKR